MKKKLFAIIISAMMIVSLLPSMAFAEVNPKSAQAITDAGIRTKMKMTADAYTGEQWAENYMNNYYSEVKSGKYGLINTKYVKKAVDNNDYLIIDTMPTGWFAGRHIPGAVNIPTKLTNNNNDVNYDSKKAVASVTKLVGKKDSWKKVSKSTYKKLKKSQRKAVKKNGKYTYYKKVSGTNYAKPIIVYCGFMGCSRSHELAKDLVKAGFTKVYRYSGGITAWVDSGYAIEGSDNLDVDKTNNKVSIQCTVNDDVTTSASHWFIVNNNGSMAKNAPLNTAVSTDDFYDALHEIAGDNMWNDSTESLQNGEAESIDDCVGAGKGNGNYAKFDVTVTWGGHTYNLEDIVTEAKYNSTDYTGDYKIAYTGNLNNQKNAKTGCITCFGGCFMGISSGHDTAMMISYKPANLPAAGETVTVTYTLATPE